MTRNRYTLHEGVGSPGEWDYSWQIRDDVTLNSTCDFCGRTGQRLTYEVTRDVQVAWICTNCVGRYNLGAELDGYRIGPKAARSHAHGLTARLKQQTCSEIIRRTQAALPDFVLEEAVVYFDRNLQLSPPYAARLFAALVQLGEETNLQIFEVQTRSNLHQQEFGELSDAERQLVWAALSPQQRCRLASLGFAPAGVVVRRNATARAARTESRLSARRMPALTEVASLNPKPKA